MKKLFILALVLGMTSIASATLSLSVTEWSPGSATIDMIAIGETADSYEAITIEGSGAFSNSRLGPAAPSLSGYFANVAELDPSLVGEIWIFGTAPGEEYKDGVWMSVDVTYTPFMAFVTLWSFDGESTLTKIGMSPEPMTLALLGFGSLFLHRRMR